MASEIEAMAFINGAGRFAWAAEGLLPLLKPPADPNVGPLYLLMAQAIELALKGYLRLQGLSTSILAHPPYGHNLRKLYHACEERGLVVHGDPLSIVNVISLLDKSNRDQGLRYFTLAPQSFPDPEWGVGAVREILDTVHDAARSVLPDADEPGPAVKIQFTVSQPVPK